ncbi:MAG: NIPSNAP family protein [Microthrixaceae bacterium]
MYYRVRIYDVVPEHLDVFTEFFLTHLLPVQKRHGARLVGRWVTEDRARVLVVWEYDRRLDYERIDADVRSDPNSHTAQQHRRESLPAFVISSEELLMESTVPLASTMLGTADRRIA